jgi:hypothetical protein
LRTRICRIVLDIVKRSKKEGQEWREGARASLATAHRGLLFCQKRMADRQLRIRKMETLRLHNSTARSPTVPFPIDPLHASTAKHAPISPPACDVVETSKIWSNLSFACSHAFQFYRAVLEYRVTSSITSHPMQSCTETPNRRMGKTDPDNRRARGRKEKK